jgi:hypothetical protein
MASVNALVVVEENLEMQVVQCESIPVQNYQEPEYWALIIGTKKDDNDWLVGEMWSIPHAKYLKSVLCNFGWKEDNINLLTGCVTRADLDDALSWLTEVVEPCDTVLISLSDHGYRGGFVLYKDYSGISYRELDQALDKINCGAMGIMIDACYSGSAIPYLQQDNRVIYTACKADETSSTNHFPSKGICDFADYKKGLGNCDGVISFEEFISFYIDEIFLEIFEEHPQMQDDYTGQLHLVFQDWSKERLDQLPEITHRESSSCPVGIYENENHRLAAAQSFIPSFDVLTKVRLKIKFTATEDLPPLTLSIRDSLTGDDLTSISLPCEEIKNKPTFYVTFDFSDIDVTPGDTYYIVCKTSVENGKYMQYTWTGRAEDVYDNGEAFISEDNGETWFVSNRAADLFFATYGKDKDGNFPPYIPKRPFGPKQIEKNKIYSYFVSTDDVDGDKIYYLFDWGDGTDSGWLGPYESGEKAIATHSWSEEGSYHVKVKVKDEHGVENSWSSILEVRVGNDAPSVPVISRNIFFRYTFELNDPNGDVMYLYVDWGDGTNTGWIGCWDTGESVTLTHLVGPDNTVSAKAKDIWGAESEWGTLEVTIPNNYNSESSQQQSGSSQQFTSTTSAITG